MSREAAPRIRIVALRSAASLVLIRIGQTVEYSIQTTHHRHQRITLHSARTRTGTLSETTPAAAAAAAAEGGAGEGEAAIGGTVSVGAETGSRRTGSSSTAETGWRGTVEAVVLRLVVGPGIKACPGISGVWRDGGGRVIVGFGGCVGGDIDLGKSWLVGVYYGGCLWTDDLSEVGFTVRACQAAAIA